MPEHDPDFIVVLVWCLWFSWITVLGACVGSFLNVLVYRLPRRKSLVHPPSHCPVCGHGIRWYDNVPVVGWIKLRGRCRDCQSPISIRYPCVEGFCGVLFGGTFFLLERLLPLSFEWQLVLTLLLSLSGTVVLAVGLMIYDKRN